MSVDVYRIYDVVPERSVALRRGGFVLVHGRRSIWDRLAEEIQLEYDRQFVRDVQ